MPKQFDDWNKTKQGLDSIASEAPFVSVGDLWWFSVGENIGSEMNGKSRLFSRPAVILKKLAHGFYLIAPSTTKSKVGTWYVPIKQNDVLMQICLHQIRTVDFRRLSTKLGTVDDADLQRIRIGFSKLYL